MRYREVIYHNLDVSLMDVVKKIRMEAGIVQHYTNELCMQEIWERKNPQVVKMRGNIVVAKFPDTSTIESLCEKIMNDIEMVETEAKIEIQNVGSDVSLNTVYIQSVINNAKEVVTQYQENMEVINKFYPIREE